MAAPQCSTPITMVALIIALLDLVYSMLFQAVGVLETA